MNLTVQKIQSGHPTKQWVRRGVVLKLLEPDVQVGSYLQPQELHHQTDNQVWEVDSACSLVPRPFLPPVFDRLQYKNGGEGLGERVTCVMSGRREGGGARSL